MNSTLQIGRNSGSFVKAANVVAQSGTKTVRRNAGTGPGGEIDLTVSHQETGGKVPARRSLYRVDHKYTTTSGDAAVQSVLVQLVTPIVPGTLPMTTTNIADILRGLAENNSQADLNAFFIGEI